MTAPLVPKLCGADVELGNFIHGDQLPGESVGEAAACLLRALANRAGGAGVDQESQPGVEPNPQDRGRHFLRTTGGCAYIDLDHLEICLPEVRSAYDYVAYWMATLFLTREALETANADRSPANRIEVLVNNSDGRGQSYGGHLNLLVSRSAWDGIVHRRPHYLAYLAAFQISSLPITGQGKVGSENGAPPVAFQLSQRADFFETLSGAQTTYLRPIVNTRDEPHCGPRGELARLHVIFFDSTLCQVATLLKVGTMQLVTAMIEAGLVDPTLALDDPLTAVRAWSHDPTLEARCCLVSGQTVTALELQRRFLDQAEQFVAAGNAEGIVPRASELVALWRDTLDKLEHRDWPALVGRLDWVLKWTLLSQAIAERPDLDWSSPEIKHLDHLFGSLDSRVGLQASLAERGMIEEIVGEWVVSYAMSEPPSDTRASSRALLLRRIGARALEHVDWDQVRFRARDLSGSVRTWRIDLVDPLDPGPGAPPADLATAPLSQLLQAFDAVAAEPRWTVEYPASASWPAWSDSWHRRA